MKSILLIGRDGQVSRYLQSELTAGYSLLVVGRDTLDFTKPDRISEVLAQYQPSIIINPAAYTAVDLAEQEPDAAFTINRDAVAALANYSRLMNTPLIHYSTDYVFSGEARTPYTEQDQADPAGVYGHSKYAGEQAILRAGAPAIILRTSWVYSNQGKNFYRTMLKLAETRSELKVVADQFGAPTYAGSIARATRNLVDLILQQGHLQPDQTGVYHFTCGGQTSWCDFAKAIFAAHQLDHIQVDAITTEDYPTPAKRPAYSVLDNHKLHDVFGLSLPTWQEGLAACVAETAAAS